MWGLFRARKEVDTTGIYATVGGNTWGWRGSSKFFCAAHAGPRALPDPHTKDMYSASPVGEPRNRFHFEDRSAANVLVHCGEGSRTATGTVPTRERIGLEPLGISLIHYSHVKPWACCDNMGAYAPLESQKMLLHFITSITTKTVDEAQAT